MFYLTIPLAVMLFSLAGITAIIWRKLPYIKKLTPEAHDSGDSFILELAPEVRVLSEKIKLKEYKDRFLVELEKFLRRIRLFFLKSDALAESLIKKVRRSHRVSRMPIENQAISTTDIPSFLKPAVEELVTQIKAKRTKKMSLEEMKQKEQELIVEIAKDPKNFGFYVQLGELYVKMNSLTDAKEAFETVLKLDPGNATAEENLKKVSAKLGSSESS